ncbi:O-methyltransferase [Fluviicola taffensis]|uniref:Caffeoyl-CoA O-methyltransferase n=1 Tax=Fluviicola taffensis (strain DSM 16823 / NCIMB 13979 / RW262) TaxID=755732 RepID=F2IKG0_FLUTR|nr:class I SAM-dependent methyltransferase [Fluviicola taffensis]AEA45086.1 Caffeoyl-CoA O-methyltransferase [Fluviicola taffensis DSM 16823]
MEFIDQALDDYCCVHTSAESELLAKLNRDTHVNVLQPRMLSGHFQGRLLSLLSKMIRPERILEIGTYTGYSALCMAEGLTENGKIITLDINAQLEDFVRSYIEESDYASKIDYRICNAMEEIPHLEEQFDLVFIDADKMNYINYYNLVFNKVKSGGYILSDNVLWSGKVIQTEGKIDKDTQLLKDFNDLIQNDSRVENILLPIRDGVMIARKK